MFPQPERLLRIAGRAVAVAAVLTLLVWWASGPTPFAKSALAAAQADQRLPPPTRLNKVIELFENDQPAFGIFCATRSLRNAVALSSSPLDFVLLDMEHAPLDFEALEVFFMAMIDKRRVLEKGHAQPDVMPFVRLPQNGREQLQFLIKQALDVGSHGLMLPHIDNAEEALAAVRAARYPQRRGASDFEPAGLRGAAYGYAARVWGITNDEYARVADVWPHDPQGEILLIHQIESTRGVEHIEEILDVPGVGAIFIGPADLSFSLGVDSDHPDLEAAVQRVLAACRKKGVPCGIPANAETAPQRLQQGFRFLTIGGNAGLDANAEAALQAARNAAPK